MLSILNQDDYRHILSSDQHEAFYFQFSTPDSQAFGFVRTLFGQSTVLELIALHVDNQTWVYQRGSPLAGALGPTYDASGPALTLQCLQPWIEWRCAYHGQVRNVVSDEIGSLQLNMRFRTETPASRYRFGPYQQVQQDGALIGSLRLNGREHRSEFLCMRDRSWGKRQMHIAQDWITACAPHHLYLALIHIDAQQMHFGHFFLPQGQRELFKVPQVRRDDSVWHIEDVEAGLGAWTAQRLVQPFSVFLGDAGQETLRLERRPGDLYYDEIVPAMYTAPDGRHAPGFLEEARRLT